MGLFSTFLPSGTGSRARAVTGYDLKNGYNAAV
jgi:hypothetical protein